MEPDPRESTGDLGYDAAHEVTGHLPPRGGTPRSPGTDGRADRAGDDGAGDYGYDEAHDFRR